MVVRGIIGSSILPCTFHFNQIKLKTTLTPWSNPSTTDAKMHIHEKRSFEPSPPEHVAVQCHRRLTCSRKISLSNSEFPIYNSKQMAKLKKKAERWIHLIVQPFFGSLWFPLTTASKTSENNRAHLLFLWTFTYLNKNFENQEML